MPVKAMEYTLDQNDPNVTKTTGTAASMTDIAVWKVPRHTAYLLRPNDFIAAYLKDAGAEMVATDAYELVIRDPNGISSEVISSGIYALIKEFQDSSKTRKIGKAHLVKSDFQIALRAKATTVLVVASCYYSISCLRYSETL